MGMTLISFAACDLAIIGHACRLPGADNTASLWRLMLEGRSAVRDLPEGRWAIDRALHPRRTEPGFAYTFAGGYIEDPFAFDPVAFGISPREAQQIDPQQRVLLEVVWRALEDAGIPASATARQSVGVYVGASNVDYQSSASGDPASVESHFMTGNALAIISNRLSYVFDWVGPSFTVDSACSSSFVALAQAARALEAGEIDTAVVAGVNLLLSPAPFVGFSRASMLSPTGRCRPFSGAADGYVRSEGAIALVLRRREDALAARNRIHAVVAGAGVNSDGRTSGIALPSVEGQRRLIEDTYGALGLSPDDLAFVEAHGTGTPVGDPIEAEAIGTALGRARATALPIGSVKSNIGHLECVSGLAGLMKATLALQHQVYPRTIHLDSLNPRVDFAALNLAPAIADVAFDRARTPFAGICNYGFGGTNAHVVLRAVEPAPAAPSPSATARLLVLSARSQEALRALAGLHAERIENSANVPAETAAAVRHQRDLLDQRLAVPLEDTTAAAAALRRFAAGEKDDAGVAAGTAATRSGKLAFVYSGNGAQWAGMGRAALARSAAFRAAFEEIDQLYLAEGGWSLREKLLAPGLEADIERTSVAQPLIFAIQCALTSALADFGVRPDAVLGHSVGEVAAAAASGALDLREAVHLIHHRSLRQEIAAGRGRMLALAASEEQARALLDALAHPDLQLAAINGPHSVTLSGSGEAIAAAEKAARARRMATVAIGVNYPFHSHLLDDAEEGIRADLAGLSPRATRVDLVSTVTGALAAGETLDAGYWWRNIREPVRFSDAIACAAGLGVTHFLEIGPRPILLAATSETLRAAGVSAACIGSLSERDERTGADPVAVTAARAVARGARVDETRVFGPAPQEPAALPPYPFQRQRFVLPETSEALDVFGSLFGSTPSHPILGRKVSQGVPEWRGFVDAEVVPYIADHQVQDDIVVPGASLAEMVLSVGRQMFGDGPLELSDFDVLRPLTLSDGAMREVSTRFDEATRRCEIWARRRLGGGAFLLHAVGHVAPASGTPAEPVWPDRTRLFPVTGAEVYAASERCGLHYGPSFRRMISLERDADGGIGLLAPGTLPLGHFQNRHVIDPAGLDAALHPLSLDSEPIYGEVRTHLPVRIASLTVWQPGVPIVHTILRRARQNRFTAAVDVVLMAEDKSVVAEIKDLVLRDVLLSRQDDEERQFHLELEPLPPAGSRAAAEAPAPEVPEGADAPALLLLRGFVRSHVYETVRALGADILPAALALTGEIDRGAEALLSRLLEHLAGLGLAEGGEAGWQLLEAELPAADAIFRTLAARCPEAIAEIRVAAHLMATLKDALTRGTPTALPPSLAELAEEDALAFRPALDALTQTLDARTKAAAPCRPHLLVARPWTAGLVRVLLPLARAGRAHVTFAGADATAFERIVAGAGEGTFAFLDPSDDTARLAPVDLVVGLAAAPLFGGNAEEGQRIAAWAAGAEVLVSCPAPDSAMDILLGVADAPHRRIPGAAETEAMLADAGCDAPMRTDTGTACLLQGRLPAAGMPAEAAHLLVLAMPGTAAFCAALAGEGDAVIGPDAPLPAGEPAPRTVVVPLAAEPGQAPREALAGHLLALKRILAWAQEGGAQRVWVLTSGARAVADEALDPVAVALAAFCRVAMNEHPGIDLRLLDAEALSAEAAPRLRSRILDAGRETEIAARPERDFGLRVLRGTARTEAPADDARRVRLHVPQQGVLASMEWIAEPRLAPKEGEVEIEVAATGLNFRDVMLALGALDDDILGPGLTSTSLGFECAGTVARVGPGVTQLKVGDMVMGFAPDAFATHVTVPAWYAFKVPEGVPPEAAAAIPVAFSTAWYALVERARLTAGESVLIHGGAGGVGLAAVAIALSRGARVIATAGTPEKAALLKALGVSAVYNSRDLAFAADIARDHGKVDVVLNSLAGDAMAASLRLVKPFGRFVELGKRDFLANTALGLRPFARNISYFGVDLDQLLAHDPSQAEVMMRDIGAAFASGALGPIPYRVMTGEEVEEAYRQMQGARHVGKIVVRPARRGRLRPAEPPAPVLREGVHLVVGGGGGFGFETAMWIAQRTSGMVVAASRGGVREPDLVARMEAANAAGARIVSAQVDARDPAALSALVEQLVAQHGPLRGVYHTAMVLEDGLIANLGPQSLATVLAPKVDGVLALDRITERHPVDQFVVYSSASAMIGSPGQGAYVAANAFLEGVVRNRRRRGLPGLSVGWGAISDVGVIAKDEALGQRLARATGVAGITSREGLAYLGRLIAMGDAAPAVNVYAQVNGSAIARQVAVLRTPTFPNLFPGAAQSAIGESEDLRDRIDGKTEEEAHEILDAVLAREIAAILRLPLDAVNADAVLADLGMDSLMALELRLTLEKKFSLELPLLSIGSGRTLGDLTRVAIASLRGADASGTAEEPALAPERAAVGAHRA
ncbi:SDR family NAD(P)-dependent oxidoreductase [Xanthobacter sediminis]|uniref:SDR family NAD(P)-dependent oxidoreductase n=1 Tax=Xanthobacter sediminis TaxID=3119926 RepID=UPI0037273BE5